MMRPYRSIRPSLARAAVAAAFFLTMATVAPAPGLRAQDPSPSAPESAAGDEALHGKIRELLERTGSADLGLQVMDAMVAQMRPLMPTVPDAWWDGFRTKVDADDMNDLVVPIYARHFTEAEIDAMLGFYRTPEGQAVVAKLPQVTEECMAAGMTWGRALAEELAEELRADGYDVD